MQNVKKILRWSLVLGILPWVSLAQEKPAEAEYLVVNNPRIKIYDFALGNITVGSAEIVDFKADREKKRITLFPKKTGNTLLLVYDTKGTEREALQLVVYPTDPERLLQEVKKLLYNVEGITITRVNEKVVIDGEIILPEDKQRIRKVASNSNQIIDLTKMSADSSQVLSKKIQKEIGLDEVTVRSIQGQIFLEGEVYSEQDRIKADKIARLYSDKVTNVIEIREVPRPPTRQATIQVTAHFVELAKNFSRNFNFKWSPVPQVGTGLSYALNPVTGSDAFTGTITGTASDLLPKLNYFKTLGVARILENPTVSVKSGEEATIQSGTRIGFPIVQPNGAVSLEFQNVGAELKIRPFIQGGEIDIEMTIKISSLGSPQVTGGVAIEESKVQTTQLVRSGDSVVVGGLIRHSNRQSIDRPYSTTTSSSSNPQSSTDSFSDPFPMGSLFTLFKSNDVSKQRSQFLVFVTPRILKFSKDANREIKDQFNLYEVYPDALNGQGENK